MGRLGQVIQYFSNLPDALLMLRIGVAVPVRHMSPAYRAAMIASREHLPWASRRPDEA
jgi:hypothetical protein